MQSTLTPKASDDPHDVIVVAPEAVRVAPSDDELSDLLHQAARVRSEPQTRTATDSSTGAAVPPVDTTFRSAVNEIPNPKGGRSLAGRAARGLMALLITVGIGLAAVGWKSYGDVAKKKIIKVATQLVLTPSLSSEEPAAAAAADTANPAAQQASTQTAAETMAPAASPDSAQLIQSMARDLASLGQEVEQIKAGMEQLKASQQQVTHDAAKASEQSLRAAKASVPAPRPAAPRVHKPPPPYYSYPQAAAAPPLPQAMAPPAPYPPRQVEPPSQTTAAPPADPELSSIPRPPMPVR